MESFIEIVTDDYKSRQGDWGSFTLSLIDTKGLDTFAAISPCFNNNEKSGSRDDIQSFDRNGKGLFFDFGDYYSRLIPAGRLTELQKAFEKTIVYKASSPHFCPLTVVLKLPTIAG